MPTHPQRIRLALIGLSASAQTAWASRAHLPYLLSPRGQSKYQIVALLNSSVSAARTAIATYSLPADSVRAYGDPADLANDDEVDLVVCTTRVDKHYATVIDSVRKGKAVFVEWPLAQDSKFAGELAEEAGRVGARTMVGLQGIKAPLAGRLRGLLEEGKIGRVVSSELRVFGALNDREKVPEGLGYFMERAVGGNIFTIGFAHTLDMVQGVLGELASVKGDFHLQRPIARLQNASGNTSQTVQSDVPDLIFLSGKWNESSLTQKNATLHYRLRRGQPFPGEPALEWTINGEKGEIRIISPQTTFIAVGDAAAPRIIEVHDFETNEVEKVEWDWEEWQQELPIPARNIGALYEAFAEAKQSSTEERYRTFEDATRRHVQLEGLLGEWQP
ncbi:hypothetical protein VTI74DRAFT_10449 [Chaetomium olivicolor]